MGKQKTNKSIFKKVKITSSGKMLRRNQLAASTYKHNKSKSAINRYKKTTAVYKSEARKYAKVLGGR